MFLWVLWAGIRLSMLLWFDFVMKTCATGDSTLSLSVLVLDFDSAFPASASASFRWWLLKHPSEGCI
jgi:hypothetical protein